MTSSLHARSLAHFSFLDPASLAGLWAHVSLLGAAATLLLGGAAFHC